MSRKISLRAKGLGQMLHLQNRLIHVSSSFSIVSRCSRLLSSKGLPFPG